MFVKHMICNRLRDAKLNPFRFSNLFYLAKDLACSTCTFVACVVLENMHPSYHYAQRENVHTDAVSNHGQTLAMPQPGLNSAKAIFKELPFCIYMHYLCPFGFSNVFSCAADLACSNANLSRVHFSMRFIKSAFPTLGLSYALLRLLMMSAYDCSCNIS